MKMQKALLTFILMLALTTLASAQTYNFYTVKSNTLNIRSGAGTEYEIIGTLSKGMSVLKIDTILNWKKFKVEEEIFEVSDEKIKAFLSIHPDAQELSTLTVDKDVFHIPISNLDSFMAENPNAIAKNAWLYISYLDFKGYVFAEHLSFERSWTVLKKDTKKKEILLKTPSSDKSWNKKNYQSGQTPECENVDPRYDYKLDNYLKVNVGSHTDVVIKLMKKQYGGDLCIRVVYIRSNETYYLKNIPEGNYYLKIAYGSDWRQKIVDQQCYGKFMKNAQYEIGKERLDYNVIHKNDGYQVPSFELSLDVIVKRGTKPTFNSNDISEAEFNK
jgi:hypothetical protein